MLEARPEGVAWKFLVKQIRRRYYLKVGIQKLLKKESARILQIKLANCREAIGIKNNIAIFYIC